MYFGCTWSLYSSSSDQMFHRIKKFKEEAFLADKIVPSELTNVCIRDRNLPRGRSPAPIQASILVRKRVYYTIESGRCTRLSIKTIVKRLKTWQSWAPMCYLSTDDLKTKIDQ